MAFALEQIPSNPEPIVFATNRLTLLVPKENPADIQRVHDLARPGVRLVLAVPGTPLRSYSDELIDKLAGQFEDGHLLRDQIMANLASEEDNARQVVAKIALGEADAAFVYSSDAHSQLAQDSIEIELPAGLQVQASYPLVNLAEGENYRWTDQFIQFILSPAGQAILSKWGFGPKDES